MMGMLLGDASACVDASLRCIQMLLRDASEDVSLEVIVDATIIMRVCHSGYILFYSIS